MTCYRLVASSIFVFLISTSAMAQSSEPGGLPDDAVLAIRNPDEYAWRLFLYISRQALQGQAGVPDPSKTNIIQYDDDKDVVWESWALASGLDLDFSAGAPPFPVLGNASEVFKNPATQPVQWDELERGAGRNKLLAPDFKSILPLLSGAEPMLFSSSARRQFTIMIAPPGTNPAEDETRMNRSTFDTIRGSRLYSVEGIEKAAAAAHAANQATLIKFDPESKEVKARWIHLEDCDANPQCADRKRYHWRTVTKSDGQKEIWGLVSLHIITKDLPNWFWADFGHIDCETGSGACKGFVAETPLRDSTTTATSGVRPDTKDTKWEFYRLRGTQTDFVSTNGIDNVLSNPVIEATFQRSSCMTCHSYASSAAEPSVVNRGTSLPIFAGKKGVRNVGSQSFDTGRPNCQRFFSPGGNPTQACGDMFGGTPPLYFQTDFLWSIPFRAFSEVP